MTSDNQLSIISLCAKRIMLPCAGVIVFHESSVATVTTPAGVKGFPKGKREKKETLLETAMRELHEETGITSDQIELIPFPFHVIGTSEKGNPSVHYFVAEYLLDANDTVFTFSPDELGEVKWETVEDMLNHPKLSIQRKEILQTAYQKVLSRRQFESQPGIKLTRAIASHNVALVKSLLEEKADPNFHIPFYDDQSIEEQKHQPNTPLRLVVFRISDCLLTPADLLEFERITKLLIEAGADTKSAYELAVLRYGPLTSSISADSSTFQRILANVRIPIDR